MGSKNWKKWKRSFAKRHDRVVRFLKMPQLAILNQDYETSLRRWRADQAENKLRYEYDLSSDDVVLDLGGYEGSWAAEIFARYGCKIHVFEPMPAYYDAICNRFSRNQRIQSHPFGLSKTTCTTSLSVEDDASSQWKKSSNQVEIQLRDAAAFLEQLGLEELGGAKIGLCKINIEGGEYELLERLLDTGCISQFQNLQIQFHTFVPEATARMEAIQRRLQETHELTYQYRFVWENWRLRSQASAAA